MFNLEAEVWPGYWHSGCKDTACNASTPYVHWFLSRLLHFQSSLLMAREEQQDSPSVYSALHSHGRHKRCSSLPDIPLIFAAIRGMNQQTENLSVTVRNKQIFKNFKDSGINTKGPGVSTQFKLLTTASC